MMMSKHTPGPWKQGGYVFYASAYSKGVHPVHAKKRGLIASANREADARLIAAAPALLEALRLAREWFNHEEAGEGPQAFDVIAAAETL
jgi:hypothetical protein